MLVLALLRPIANFVLPTERRIIRLSPDSVPPIMRVFSPWGQAFGLVILTLNVTRLAAEPIGTDLESHSIISSIEGAFDDFKNDVESDIAKALVGNDGVLAQFGMELQTYAMRFIAPARGLR